MDENGALAAAFDPVNNALRVSQSGATVPTTTKGDLAGFSTVSARVPVGTDGQVLTADSAQTLGVKWATPAAAAPPIDGLVAAAGTIAFGTGITGDTVDRFTALGSGGLRWGPGNAVVDCQLNRVSSGVLRFQSTGIQIDGNIQIGASADVTLNGGGSGWLNNNGGYKAGSAGPAFWFANAGSQQTTVGAAGAASALPETPTKYFQVKDSAGTTLIIPAYAAA